MVECGPVRADYEKLDGRQRHEIGIHTNCPYPRTAIASTTPTLPTRNISARSTRAREIPDHKRKRARKRSREDGAAANQFVGVEYAVKWARDENTERRNMRVVSVQKGPYRTADVRWVEDRRETRGGGTCNNVWGPGWNDIGNRYGRNQGRRPTVDVSTSLVVL